MSQPLITLATVGCSESIFLFVFFSAVWVAVIWTL